MRRVPVTRLHAGCLSWFDLSALPLNSIEASACCYLRACNLSRLLRSGGSGEATDYYLYLTASNTYCDGSIAWATACLLDDGRYRVTVYMKYAIVRMHTFIKPSYRDAMHLLRGVASSSLKSFSVVFVIQLAAGRFRSGAQWDLYICTQYGSGLELYYQEQQSATPARNLRLLP